MSLFISWCSGTCCWQLSLFHKARFSCARALHSHSPKSLTIPIIIHVSVWPVVSMTIARHKKTQVSKYYYTKTSSSHISNGLMVRMMPTTTPGSNPGRPWADSLTFDATPTYHVGEHGRAYTMQHSNTTILHAHPPDTKCELVWFPSGAFYEIDHDKLPPKSPIIHHKSVRVVKVRCLFMGFNCCSQFLNRLWSSFVSPDVCA